MTQTPTNPRMTIGQQVLAGFAVSLVVTLVLVLVAISALGRVADAKDRVIDRHARLVIDSYRLDVAVEARSGAARTFLLTGDEEYVETADESERRFAQVLAALSENVRTARGTQLIAEIEETEGRWDDALDDVFERFRAGAIAPEQLGEAVTTDLAPPRRQLSALVEELIEREELQIEEADADADDTASRTRILLWVLGGAALVLALSVGAGITRVVTRRLTGLALTVDSAAAEILASTTQHVAGASEQAASVQETVATTDELAQTAEQSAERARSVADRAQRSAEVATRGTRAVADSAVGMTTISEQVATIADVVVALSERARDISAIVSTVEDIADQTHLLALNAAIEAARAGEHGRGFSVVAGEIRALADQSRRATAQVATILGEIEQGTHSAVMATEQGNKSVTEGAKRIEEAGETITELSGTVEAAAIAAEQIAASSGQQAVATAQISQAMRDLDEVTQQNVASASQSEAAARDLNQVALDLKALVGAG